jgi:hypothetical protein
MAEKLSIEEKTKIYLEYLDKEMTIMGLLSTFALVALGATLNGVLGAESYRQNVLRSVWEKGHWNVIAGSIWMLLAALGFYFQRSRLALCYHDALGLLTTRN